MKNRNPIILFDGICNLCNGSIDFILKRDVTKQFQFVPSQSERGDELKTRYKISKETNSVVLISENRIYTESEAVLEACRFMSFPWNWMVVFKIIPKKWRNAMYRWIAKNRYQWFGKRKDCRVI
jgi:predicted DCC family thiol-disulfide oxidoreductase YuxK